MYSSTNSVTSTACLYESSRRACRRYTNRAYRSTRAAASYEACLFFLVIQRFTPPGNLCVFTLGAELDAHSFLSTARLKFVLRKGGMRQTYPGLLLLSREIAHSAGC